MATFDPDAYLNAVDKPKKDTSGFDPDTYLKQVSQPSSESQAQPQAQPDEEGLLPKINRWSDKPLISPQTLANVESLGIAPPNFEEMAKTKGSVPEEYAKGVQRGIYNVESKMITPKNIAVGIGSALAPPLGLAYGIYNAPSMIKGAYEGFKAGNEARKAGEYQKAGEQYMGAGANALMTLGLAKGAAEQVLPGENAYSGAATPAIQEIAKEGYPLTAAEITQTRPQQWAQRLFERGPLTGQMFKNFGEKQRAALAEDIGEFQGQVGETTPENVAESTLQGIGEKTKSFRNKASELYDKVTQLAGQKEGPMGNLYKSITDVLQNEEGMLKGTKMTSVTNKLQKTLADIKSEQGVVLSPSELEELQIDPQYESKLAALRERIPEEHKLFNSEVKGKTFDQMRKIKSRFADLAQSGDIVSTPEKGIYKQLVKAVQNDMDNFVENNSEDILNAHKEANAFYKPGKELLNSELTKSLQKMAEEKPSAISNSAIKPNDVMRVQKAKELLGDKFESIRQQFTQDLIKKASIIPPGADEPVIQGPQLLRLYNQYGDKVMNEVYGPEYAAELKELARKSNISESAIKASGQGVQSRGSGPIAAITRAAATTLGLPIAALMTTKFGARFLSTGVTPLGQFSYGTAGALQRGNETPEEVPVEKNMFNSLPSKTPKGESVGLEKMSPNLKQGLSGLSDVLGKPPTITSGYRSQEEQNSLNVPGKAKVSLHSSGNAADLRIKDLSKDKIKDALMYLNSIAGLKASVHNGNHIHVENRYANR